MTWLCNSYMGRKAVARGKPGETRLLNKAVQGEYHCVYGPYTETNLPDLFRQALALNHTGRMATPERSARASSSLQAPPPASQWAPTQ